MATTTLLELTDAQQRRIERHEQSCLWYSWGQIDARVRPELDLNILDGQVFARWQRQVVTDFVTEKTYSMNSILGAWETFLRDVTLAREEMAAMAATGAIAGPFDAKR